MEKKKKIFVSIPYTGHEREFPARCIRAHERYDENGDVLTPIDIIEDDTTPYNVCMGMTIAELLSCDLVIFADGWHESKGCQLEHRAAEIYGIECMTDAKI